MYIFFFLKFRLLSFVYDINLWWKGVVGYIEYLYFDDKIFIDFEVKMIVWLVIDDW